MIKQLAANELSLTRDVAFAFFLESKLDGKLNFGHFMSKWGELITLGLGSIFVNMPGISSQADAIIGGTCTQCLMTADLIAQEAFWFVSPEERGGPCGIRLLRAWEKWSIDKGAKRLYVGNLVDLNAGLMHSIYTRMGYKTLETHYVKNVPLH